MKAAIIAGCVALLLTTGAAHAIEYQGKLPKPVQRLPSYPPVVCVAPNWVTESCEDRQPRYWLAVLSDLFKLLERLDRSWIGTAIKSDQPRPWNGKWPDEARADDDEGEGGFPKEVQGLWCLSPSESTKTKIILNPHADGCKPDEGVILISYSQFYGRMARMIARLIQKPK
jgi:hypothetical protein